MLFRSQPAPRSLPAAAKAGVLRRVELRTSAGGVLDDAWLRSTLALPAGVTLTDAAIDTGASSCTDEVGTVTRSGNTVKISGISCANGQELAVDVEGDSYIAVDGSYDVSSEFKTQAPRRPQQQTTMWQEIDYDSFVVVD